jgi:hypothetical protein
MADSEQQHETLLWKNIITSNTQMTMAIKNGLKI